MAENLEGVIHSDAQALESDGVDAGLEKLAERLAPAQAAVDRLPPVSSGAVACHRPAEIDDGLRLAGGPDRAPGREVEERDDGEEASPRSSVAPESRPAER